MHDQLRDTVTWQRCLCSYRQRKIDHNFINLTTPWPEEEHEFAVLGTPEKEDKKRENIWNWEYLVKTKRKERTLTPFNLTP